MKRASMYVFILLCVFLCGCSSSPKVISDPAVIKIHNKTIKLFDDRRKIENILGEPNDYDAILGYHYLNDDILVFYRTIDDKQLAVCFHIKSSDFDTYMNVNVGDNWFLVREKLGINTNIYGAWFDSQHIIRSPLHDKDFDTWSPDLIQDDWVCVTYLKYGSDPDVISDIIIGDRLSITQNK